jgi:hypothetical protein
MLNGRDHQKLMKTEEQNLEILRVYFMEKGWRNKKASENEKKRYNYGSLT